MTSTSWTAATARHRAAGHVLCRVCIYIHLQPGQTAQLHTLLPVQPVRQLQQIQPDLLVPVQPLREPGECEPREPGECEPGEYVSYLCFTVILQ